MKVTAIISEYNPLHLGHIMHIKTATEETGADSIMAVMSGDYVQRGTPAIVSKYVRAHSALIAGSDLVLELPLYYSTGSIDYFAVGAVSLIQKTGIVNCISFGSECGDIELLKKAARLTYSLNDAENETVRELLSSGMSYSNAVNSVCDLPENIRDLLKTPNNLLAVSYIKAAWSLSFDCELHTVKRIGSAYHDDAAGALSSTAIRKELIALRETPDHFQDGLHNVLSGRMPDDICSLLIQSIQNDHILSEDDFALLLFYKISMSTDTLASFMDVSESLASKITGRYKHADSYSDLCGRLKSRDLNYSRISRALLHILLDIKKDHMDEYRADGYNYYIKPLAFKKASDTLMHDLKNLSDVPIISKNADAEKLLSGRALRMFNEGVKASDLYNKTACSLSRRPFRSEYERSPVII